MQLNQAAQFWGQPEPYTCVCVCRRGTSGTETSKYTVTLGISTYFGPAIHIYHCPDAILSHKYPQLYD
jgi:hypothetical protein